MRVVRNKRCESDEDARKRVKKKGLKQGFEGKYVDETDIGEKEEPNVCPEENKEPTKNKKNSNSSTRENNPKDNTIESKTDGPIVEAPPVVKSNVMVDMKPKIPEPSMSPGMNAQVFDVVESERWIEATTPTISISAPKSFLSPFPVTNSIKTLWDIKTTKLYNNVIMEHKLQMKPWNDQEEYIHSRVDLKNRIKQELAYVPIGLETVKAPLEGGPVNRVFSPGNAGFDMFKFANMDENEELIEVLRRYSTYRRIRGDIDNPNSRDKKQGWAYIAPEEHTFMRGIMDIFDNMLEGPHAADSLWNYFRLYNNEYYYLLSLNQTERYEYKYFSFPWNLDVLGQWLEHPNNKSIRLILYHWFKSIPTTYVRLTPSNVAPIIRELSIDMGFRTTQLHTWANVPSAIESSSGADYVLNLLTVCLFNKYVRFDRVDVEYTYNPLRWADITARLLNDDYYSLCTESMFFEDINYWIRFGPGRDMNHSNSDKMLQYNSTQYYRTALEDYLDGVTPSSELRDAVRDFIDTVIVSKMENIHASKFTPAKETLFIPVNSQQPTTDYRLPKSEKFARLVRAYSDIRVKFDDYREKINQENFLIFLNSHCSNMGIRGRRLNYALELLSIVPLSGATVENNVDESYYYRIPYKTGSCLASLFSIDYEKLDKMIPDIQLAMDVWDLHKFFNELSYYMNYYEKVYNNVRVERQRIWESAIRATTCQPGLANYMLEQVKTILKHKFVVPRNVELPKHLVEVERLVDDYYDTVLPFMGVSPEGYYGVAGFKTRQTDNNLYAPIRRKYVYEGKTEHDLKTTYADYEQYTSIGRKSDLIADTMEKNQVVFFDIPITYKLVEVDGSDADQWRVKNPITAIKRDIPSFSQLTIPYRRGDKDSSRSDDQIAPLEPPRFVLNYWPQLIFSPVQFLYYMAKQVSIDVKEYTPLEPKEFTFAMRKVLPSKF